MLPVYIAANKSERTVFQKQADVLGKIFDRPPVSGFWLGRYNCKTCDSNQFFDLAISKKMIVSLDNFFAAAPGNEGVAAGEPETTLTSVPNSEEQFSFGLEDTFYL